LLAHASSCLWASYHLKGCLAQGLPSLFRIFQNSKQYLFLVSSQDTEEGYLTYCFQPGLSPRTSLGTIFSGSSQHYLISKDLSLIQSKDKLKEFFILKLQQVTFQK
jgi:hypothetical protein